MIKRLILPFISISIIVFLFAFVLNLKKENIDQPTTPDQEEIFAMTPEDCIPPEKYDPEEKVCFIECGTEAECQKTEKEIEEKAEEIGDPFFEGQENFNELKEEEGTTLAVYKVENDENKLLSKPEVSANLKPLQDDTGKHKAVWNRFIKIIPSSERKDLSFFEIFTDGKENTFGAITQDENDPAKWVLIIDIGDAFEKDKLQDKELTYTLIHEFGHLFTLNKSQIDYRISSEENCQPRYLTDEGCTKGNSYLNNFVKNFWMDILSEKRNMENISDEERYTKEADNFYLKYKDRFVTDYAATNPEEDIVETWTAFVLQEKKSCNTLLEKKICFFGEFEELNKLRKIIRSRL